MQPEFLAQFPEKLRSVGRIVERGIDALLQPTTSGDEIIRPKGLLDAMRYAVLDGGKRLRPFLLIETAALMDVPPAQALRAACALEMVHGYSLVHDDLPAMDNDDMRRGRATVHRAFDEATAILVGDSLLTYAFDILADAQTHPDAHIRLKLVQKLAQAAGLGGMAGGQWLDLAAEASPRALTQAEILQLQAMKTGALLTCAVASGAILAGTSPGQTRALLTYAENLGIAFQIADDILDVEGDAATLGKQAQKDAERNKGTLVQILGLAGAKALRDQKLEAGLKALDEAGFGDRAQWLRAAAHFVAHRES
ncbi:MAG: polyprenyl synthetase family protein [Hyphomicrobiales bacterium]|nr:polyprenyl synthetase family protein [Hyphomicrobiales bacterium]MDE2114191.1 polyprenyl synthetase family protein [Hyphomicrobiales bacterium]